MKAEFVAIGTEILLGEIVDTNGAWIARQLPELGIDLLYKSAVGDNIGRIVETFRRASERSDLIIVSGGLGPTSDDLTREAIAAHCGEVPEVDPVLADHLRTFFARRGLVMPQENLKQAWLIPSARALDNPRGTAPGWWVERNDNVFVCLPGVPTELERMWTFEVRPELARRSSGEVLILRTLKTVGLGESALDERVKHLYSTPGIGIGTYARADGVHIRIGAKANDERAARARIEPVEREIELLLGDAVWGRDDDSFERYLAEKFSGLGLSLSVLDAGTGGYVASLLADEPQAASYLRSAQIAFTADDLIRNGVPAQTIDAFGMRSREATRAIARAARESGGTAFGLGINGILEPQHEAGAEQGTVYISVATAAGTHADVTATVNVGRQAARRRVATSAMMLLRRALAASTP